jgi:hypothetical protein
LEPELAKKVKLNSEKSMMIPFAPKSDDEEFEIQEKRPKPRDGSTRERKKVEKFFPVHVKHPRGKPRPKMNSKFRELLTKLREVSRHKYAEEIISDDEDTGAPGLRTFEERMLNGNYSTGSDFYNAIVPALQKRIDEYPRYTSKRINSSEILGKIKEDI